MEVASNYPAEKGYLGGKRLANELIDTISLAASVNSLGGSTRSSRREPCGACRMSLQAVQEARSVSTPGPSALSRSAGETEVASNYPVEKGYLGA
jgi:hypothetical protein